MCEAVETIALRNCDSEVPRRVRKVHVSGVQNEWIYCADVMGSTSKFLRSPERRCAFTYSFMAHWVLMGIVLCGLILKVRMGSFSSWLRLA